MDAPLLGRRSVERKRKGRRELSPTERAVYGTMAGLVALAVVFTALIAVRPSTGAPGDVGDALPGRELVSSGGTVPERAASATGSGAPLPSTGAASTHGGTGSSSMLHGTPIAGPWRIAELAGSPDHKLVEGTVERRAFVDALRDSGVPKAQVYRLLDAFKGIKRFDKTKPRDTFVVALEPRTHRVRAFEYQAGPTEIYQARAEADGPLVASRLDLHVEQKRVAAAVVVGEDLAASFVAAGLDSSLLDQLDDALEGRAQLSSIRPATRLRVVADYETALGVFARYTDLRAVELAPSAPNVEPLRVYHVNSGTARGYFDARGKQPYKGGFRTPIPFARISSRFNMHRMHPILRVVRPHNGVDFAASVGTPVYAAAAGTIASIGDSGPSGNLITIKHPGGLTTGYAHLSRFAARLGVGHAVDTRQLIGYVGSTGRSTGPHLHFSTKKNGVFIDPLSLRLDGDRVLPKSERAAFEIVRAQLDQVLDAIPLPHVAAPHVESAETDDQEPLEETDHVH